MSKHYVLSRHGDLEVHVSMGWDRPLQGFFLDIEAVPIATSDAAADKSGIDEDDDEEDSSMIYDTLYDPDLLPHRGMATNLAYVISKLKQLDIAVPQAMVDEVLSDFRSNIGNRFVEWNMDGTMNEKLPADSRDRQRA